MTDQLLGQKTAQNRARVLTKRFASDRSGNFTIMFTVAVVALVLAGGLAIDFSRAVTSQSTSRNALDAAILATARELANGAIEPNEAQAFLVNYLEGILATSLGSGSDFQLANFSLDNGTETITASLTHNLPMTLMAVGGVKSKKFTAESAASYGLEKTEITMTFDVTGSMRGSKIADLKRAASNGISELLTGNAVTTGNLRISIVPYAEGVNSGPLYQTVFVESEGTSGPPPKDTDPIDVSAATDKCATERKGPAQYTDDSPRVGKINRDFRLNTCPASPLIPLTSNKALLLNAIDDMTVGGGTAGHIGIQWAWYLISPKWADYVPAGSAAAEYTSTARKYAIIMTDGEFNIAYADLGNNETPRGQARKSMAKAKKLCANMKQKGIEIFTIGFALTQNDARETMRDCASPDTDQMTYYYEASGGLELKKVYEDIATRIKQLRLVR